MNQRNFSGLEYSLRKRRTKREEFLRIMEEIIRKKTHFAGIDYRINRRAGSVQKVPVGFINWEKGIERGKSSVRSKVEHPFLIIKRYFGYGRTVYRGLAKNTHRLQALFACANLLMCARAGRSLCPSDG